MAPSDNQLPLRAIFLYAQVQAASSFARPGMAYGDSCRRRGHATKPGQDAAEGAPRWN